MSTWMVVEDEPDIYEVLLAMFEMWGIEGVAFVDGEEAMAWIEDVDNDRFQGELPELALLDVRLPGETNGIQVGERIRKSSVLGNMAIVMITAYKLPKKEHDEALIQSGCDRWLEKPLPKFNELQGILETVIAERRAMVDVKVKVKVDIEEEDTAENNIDEEGEETVEVETVQTVETVEAAVESPEEAKTSEESQDD